MGDYVDQHGNPKSMRGSEVGGEVRRREELCEECGVRTANEFGLCAVCDADDEVQRLMDRDRGD